MALLRPRDQPRAAAPIILGAGNIISGALGLLSLNDHVASYTYAAQWQPLDRWWTAQIILGALILTGPINTHLALTGALAAVGWWLCFSDFVWQAHQHLYDPHGHRLVSLRGVWSSTWMAAIMVLLTPYMRRAKPVMSRNPGG